MACPCLRLPVRGDRASPFAFYLCLSACICGCFLSVSYASPPSADVHFCLPLDAQDLRVRDSIYAATKRALNLNVGEPRTVRMIYFLPNDRPFRQEVVDSMKVTIRQIQTFFADQMQAHGYGNKTFRFETDAQGEPIVHRVDGQHPNSYYFDHTPGTVADEIREKYDLDANIYLVVIDNGTHVIGISGVIVGGTAFGGGKNGGVAFFASEFSWIAAAHELGHAFDLWHDFRDNAYIMSYGSGEKDAVVEFEYDGVIPSDRLSSLSDPTEHPISVEAIDTDGNVSRAFFELREASPHHIATLEGHTNVVWSVAFSPDGTTLASGSWDQTVRLWDITTKHNIATLEGYNVAVYTLAFSPDGTILASNAFRGIKLWEIATRTEIATFEGHTGRVTSVAFSSDGTTIASGSRDNTVRLWDVPTGQNIATLEGNSSFLNPVAFSSDGTTIASGSRDNTVKLWDVARKKNIAMLEGHSSWVRSVAFSPDGTTLASTSYREVRLWDVPTGQNIATLEGHTNVVWSVAFSPDGTTLASVSYREVRLWDVVTGENIATFEGHTGSVNSVAFSPDGTMLASSGSEDYTIKLWDMSEYVTPVVNIPDANLRAVIQDALGKSRFAPITTTDMASLTTLNASNRNIRELDGLEFATNLIALNLADNPLSAPAINTHIPILQDRGIEVLFDKIPSSDFDGDGTVDLDDFLLFVAQFGFNEDDEGYEARFDLDGDGIIGLGDFLIFANAFGKVASSN